MWIAKPSYFDAFRCIAGDCPDSCCQEWEVEVDSDYAAYYRSLPGPLGDRLRSVLRDEDGCTLMTIEDRRCPMWRADGLCRIQAELGEQALCQVCRDFPRLRHDYGDFLELGLELSCPEAARLIFSSPALPFLVSEVEGGEEPEYDAEAMAVLKATREQVLSLLDSSAHPVAQRLALVLLYGCEAQAQLDCAEAVPFDPDAALDSIADFIKPGDMDQIAEFFQGLEILKPEWKQLLKGARLTEVSPDCITLAGYLIQRYWLQAVSDYDLTCRVKFIIIACLLVSSLPGDFRRNAQLFSKEIENNLDNVEAILDAAYTSPAFTDDKLLGLLLGNELKFDFLNNATSL